MEYVYQEIVVPEELLSKLSKINLYIYNSPIDINEYLSELFMSNDFTEAVFHKSLTQEDWEKIYYGMKTEKGKKHFKNNGILFEYFSNNIISKKFKLKNLVNFKDIDIEDPKKGIDIIFLDDEFKLQFYEVKSRNTKEMEGNTNNLVELIKNAITSLFCTEMKNVVKLVEAKSALKDNKRCLESFNILKDILYNKTNNIKYIGNNNINFNICVIGERFIIDEEKLKEGIIEVFNTTKYCPPKCKKDNLFCNKKILDEIRILNIVNVQFVGNLSLKIIYEKIMQKIVLKGYLND